MSTVDFAGPTPQSRLLLMRHPETTANQQGRYLGSGEAPLSERGLLQRERAVRAFRTVKLDGIVTSPLSRCLDLASLVGAEQGMSPEVDPGIKEIGFGVLEGLTYAEAVEQNIQFLWNDPEAIRPAPEGELFCDFEDRLAEARLRMESIEGTTAVIAHGGVIRHLLKAWFDIPYASMWNLRVENVSTCVVGFDGGTPILEKFGLTPEELARISD